MTMRKNWIEKYWDEPCQIQACVNVLYTPMPDSHGTFVYIRIFTYPLILMIDINIQRSDGSYGAPEHCLK